MENTKLAEKSKTNMAASKNNLLMEAELQRVRYDCPKQTTLDEEIILKLTYFFVVATREREIHGTRRELREIEESHRRKSERGSIISNDGDH